MIRPQFTPEQRNLLVMEYNKVKGKRNIWPTILQIYITAFPDSRPPSISSVRKMLQKQNTVFTLHNCNSKSSPGPSNSGRRFTHVTERNSRRVKRVLDLDARKKLKNIGREHSPINSSRRNRLGLARSTFLRICNKLKYHPYKAKRRQALREGDYLRRVNFCHYMARKNNQQLKNFLFSDEANFDLNGHVNSQTVRMYAPARGGHPENLVHERSVSKKLMVYCGIKTTGTFGLTFFQNETMDSKKYKRLLSHRVLPELRRGNNGSLNNLTWTQDGAPCHAERRNIAYLNNQFNGRLVSRGAQREWPPRSPDLNPCDFFLWGYLKSKVYYPKPNNLQELQNAIEREVARLDPAMCKRAVLDIRSRARKCLLKDGKCFE